MAEYDHLISAMMAAKLKGEDHLMARACLLQARPPPLERTWAAARARIDEIERRLIEASEASEGVKPLLNDRHVNMRSSMERRCARCQVVKEDILRCELESGLSRTNAPAAANLCRPRSPIFHFTPYGPAGTVCKSTYYCSQKCQKKDWKEHKAKCKEIARCNELSSAVKECLDFGVDPGDATRAPHTTTYARGTPL